MRLKTWKMFWGSSSSGGTIVVAGQNGIGTQVASGQDVAAIGGFSGRETTVSVSWLADAVEDGRVRFVMTGSSGGMGGFADGRSGSDDALSVAAEVGTATSVDGMVDLQGKADALRAAAG